MEISSDAILDAARLYIKHCKMEADPDYAAYWSYSRGMMIGIQNIMRWFDVYPKFERKISALNGIAPAFNEPDVRDLVYIAEEYVITENIKNENRNDSFIFMYCNGIQDAITRLMPSEVSVKFFEEVFKLKPSLSKNIFVLGLNI